MMKKIYCIKCYKYMKFKNLKYCVLFVLSIICDKCSSNEKLFKEEESIEIFKIFG